MHTHTQCTWTCWDELNNLKRIEFEYEVHLKLCIIIGFSKNSIHKWERLIAFSFWIFVRFIVTLLVEENTLTNNIVSAMMLVRKHYIEANIDFISMKFEWSTWEIAHRKGKIWHLHIKSIQLKLLNVCKRLTVVNFA